MSVARFIADQRTNYRVPHTTVCALVGVGLVGLNGSPRLHADLREAGWVVSEKVVADSMTCCPVISPLSGPTPDGWAT
jgi:putative transposase